MNVNTTSKYPTHFLRGVELIYDGVDEYGLPSENWPHPTEHVLGRPDVDRYYAEVWVNGMDWQSTYWVIETENHEDPKVYPFIVFEDNDNRFKFNEYDFRLLVESCLWFRRNELWISHHPDNSIYNDIVWPFLYVNPDSRRLHNVYLSDGFFEHASQRRVDFIIHKAFVPGRCKNEEHWNSWNKKKGYVRSL